MANAARTYWLIGAWLLVSGCTSGGGGVVTSEDTTSGVESGSTTSTGPSMSTTSLVDDGTTVLAEGTTTQGGDDASSSSGTSTGLTRGDSSSTGSQSEGSTTESVMTMPCVEHCMVQLACTEDWRSEEACVAACEANLDEAAVFEVACAAAWEDLYTCLGTLTCEELAEWREPSQFPYPCVSEDEVLGFECAGQ